MLFHFTSNCPIQSLRSLILPVLYLNDVEYTREREEIGYKSSMNETQATNRMYNCINNNNTICAFGKCQEGLVGIKFLTTILHLKEKVY